MMLKSETSLAVCTENGHTFILCLVMDPKCFVRVATMTLSN